MLEIYTDGSYSSSRDQGGWAFVLLKEGQKIFKDLGGVIETTNNRMELQACIEAIKYCNKNNIEEFKIYSDSMYVVGTMTKNWKKKKNIDLWLKMDELQTDKIIWQHTKGHSGNKWNDYVDMLAVHGSQLILN